MKKNTVYILLIVLLTLIMVLVTIVIKDGRTSIPNTTSSPYLSNTELEPTIEPSPIPTQVPTPTTITYQDITLISSGDIMYHGPQIDAALNKETGEYNFFDNFKYIKEIVTDADYAVCNLETTLASNDNGYDYKGWPRFNAPDSVLDTIKDAGFDIILLSNNHTYDTKRVGLLRTQQKVKEKGFSSLGTQDGTSKSYMVKEINGVKIGFLNYSYESDERQKDGIWINGLFVKNEDAKLIDTFNYSLKKEFYDEVDQRMSEMNTQGADLIILYIHWGSEYQLEANSHQKEIAQKLCNLGVDVIIGSHPHVIQPMEVLTNETTGDKTICFYSLGNFISNQNRKTLTTPTTKEYTENGVLVKLTIRKYSSGETYVSYVDYTPTWVHRIKSNNGLLYQVLPLPKAFEFPDSYGMSQTSFGMEHSVVSKERTDAALRVGVDMYNDWINGVVDVAA